MTGRYLAVIVDSYGLPDFIVMDVESGSGKSGGASSPREAAYMEAASRGNVVWVHEQLDWGDGVDDRLERAAEQFRLWSGAEGVVKVTY